MYVLIYYFTCDGFREKKIFSCQTIIKTVNSINNILKCDLHVIKLKKFQQFFCYSRQTTSQAAKFWPEAKTCDCVQVWHSSSKTA